MYLIEPLAYIAVAVILLAYCIGRHFDLANAIGSVPLIINAYMHANIPSLLISLAFGLIGAWRLYDARQA